MAKNESNTPPAIKQSQDLKTRDQLAVEESKVGGLTPNASAPGDLNKDNVERALSPAGDTGKKSTTIDDPSRVGRLDPVEVAKGNTSSDGGGESQTSPAMTGAGTDEPVIQDPKAYKPREFRVKNPQRITISWKGLEVRLDPGSVLTEDSYGDGAIEQFRQSGVNLEEVKSEDQLRQEAEDAKLAEEKSREDAEEKRLLSLKGDEKTKGDKK